MNKINLLIIITIAYPFLAYGVGFLLYKMGWVTTFIRIIYLAAVILVFVQITYPFNPLGSGPQDIRSERLSQYPLYMQDIAFISALVLVGLWSRIETKMRRLEEKKQGKY